MSGIMHVVGNRPQFIKLAPLYHELERRDYEQYILHSGQHYDENMSDVFFKELKIAEPYANLKIGSGSHAEMTARALVGIEKEMIKMQPRLVVLYGDTDTTLAGALAAAKLNIPIAHIESGARTRHKDNPEECNRIVVDHLSNILFCSDQDSVKNALEEGIKENVFCTGDIMYDTFLNVAGGVETGTDEIVLMTWHRQENTDSKERMESILYLIKQIKSKIVCPMHPRTVKCLKEYNLWEYAKGLNNLEIIEPVGYAKMVELMQKAKLIVTDSGGLSKESSFAGAKCLFFSDLNVWPDLMQIGWILKVNPQEIESLKKALEFADASQRVDKEMRPCFYGDGFAAKKIIDLLEEKLYI